MISARVSTEYLPFFFMQIEYHTGTEKDGMRKVSSYSEIPFNLTKVLYLLQPYNIYMIGKCSNVLVTG